jgi:hypothetical protein
MDDAGMRQRLTVFTNNTININSIILFYYSSDITISFIMKK